MVVYYKTRERSEEQKKRMTFEEKMIKSETVYSGKVLNLRCDRVTTVNGESYREVVEHSGGAVIVALTDDGKIVMVKQFRYAAGRVMLEVPAGKTDPGEDPYETAARELREETGYTASELKLLTRMYPTPGYSKEVLSIFLARGLTPGETDFDDSEAIDLEYYTPDELEEMVLSGKIEDGKTQVAILLVTRLLKRR